MGKYTQDKYSSPKSKKAHKISKPYWNKELQDLWYDMQTSEQLFLKCKGNRADKQHLLNNFRMSQHG